MGGHNRAAWVLIGLIFMQVNEMQAQSLPDTGAKGLDTVLKGGITVDNEYIQDVLLQLSKTTGMAMMSSKSVVGRVTFSYTEDVKVRKVLYDVLPEHHWAFAVDEAAGIVKIVLEQELEFVNSAGTPPAPAEAQSTTGLNTVLKGGLTVSHEDIGDVLVIISQFSGAALVHTKSVEGRVSFAFPRDVTVRTVLNHVLPLYGWAWQANEAAGIVQIMTQAEKDQALLPTPEAAPYSIGDSTRLDTVLRGGITVSNEDIRDVLMILSQFSGMSMIPSRYVMGRVSFSFPNEVKIRTVLDSVLPAYGWSYIVKDDAGIVRVVSAAELSASSSADMGVSAVPNATALAGVAAATGFDAVIRGGITVSSMDIGDVITMLAQISGLKMAVAQGVKGSVSFSFPGDVTIRAILDNILPNYGWFYETNQLTRVVTIMPLAQLHERRVRNGTFRDSILFVSGVGCGLLLAWIQRRRRFAKLWGKQA